MIKVSDRKKIQSIVQTIVKTVHPQKVILFGSRVMGQVTKDSDYDFLVIKKIVKNERSISRRIYKALFERKIPFPVDIIVADPKKIKKYEDNPYFVYSWALKGGRTLYG